MKPCFRTLTIVIILVSVLNACRGGNTPTATASSTISTPAEILTLTPKELPVQPDSEYSFPSMVVAADESYSMTVPDDVPGQGECDPDLLRYKVPLFLARVGNSFIHRNISSADVNLWYMGQQKVTDELGDIETSLEERLKSPPQAGGKGDALFGETFGNFADYLKLHEKAKLIMVTDGDLRDTRPLDPGVATTRSDTLSVLNKIDESKGPKIYIILLCPKRLDENQSLAFWKEIESKRFIKVFYLGDNTTMESVLHDLLADILTDAGWASTPDSRFEFKSGYRTRGWDLVTLPADHDNYQFSKLPPHSLRVNYGIVPYGELKPFAETLLDSQSHTSLHGLVNPRSDCNNHILSFMDPGDLFFYWWSVDMPIFWTKWDPNSLYIRNLKGTMSADIRVLVKKSGLTNSSAKGFEDVSEQLDWTPWERCTQFMFQNLDNNVSGEVPTMGRQIHLEASDEKMLGDKTASTAIAPKFEMIFDTRSQWRLPQIPLMVVSSQEVLFADTKHSQASLYFRYIPTLTGDVKTVPVNNEITVEWSFEYLTYKYYPNWDPDWWLPSIRFVESQNGKWVDDKDCNQVSKKFDPPSDTKDGVLSYSLEKVLIMNNKCGYAELSWKDWPKNKEGWDAPPDLICNLVLKTFSGDTLELEPISCSEVIISEED